MACSFFLGFACITSDVCFERCQPSLDVFNTANTEKDYFNNSYLMWRKLSCVRVQSWRRVDDVGMLRNAIT